MVEPALDTAHRGLSVTGARLVLVDGRVAATWTATPTGQVTVTPLRPFTAAESTALADETDHLSAFLSRPGRLGVAGPG